MSSFEQPLAPPLKEQPLYREHIQEIFQEAATAADAVRSPAHRAALRGRLDAATRDIATGVRVNSNTIAEHSQPDIDVTLAAIMAMPRKSEAQHSLFRFAQATSSDGFMTDDIAKALYRAFVSLNIAASKDERIRFFLALGEGYLQEADALINETKTTPAGKRALVLKNEERIKYGILALPLRVKLGASLEESISDIEDLIEKITPDPYGHFKAARRGLLADTMLSIGADPRALLQEMMAAYAVATGDNEQATFVGWVVDRYIAYAKRVAAVDAV